MRGITTSAKNTKNSAGFTLIELSLVLLITGVLVVSLLVAYQLSRKAIRVEKETRIMQNASNALENYASFKRRFPCPAPFPDKTNPNYKSDPNYGRANWNNTTRTCQVPASQIVQGARDANFDGNPNNDQVIVGMFPLYVCGEIDITLPCTGENRTDLSELTSENEILQTEMENAWGNELTYAVTVRSTETFDDNRIGAIRIIDEFTLPGGAPRDTGGTNGNAIYAIISHGSNACDRRPVAGANLGVNPLEVENCDNNAVFRSALLNHNEANNYQNFFDDKIVFNGNTASAMWQRVSIGGVPTNNVRSLSPGSIGIRTTTPASNVKLDVNGNAFVERYAMTYYFCDPNNPNKCFYPWSVRDINCPLLTGRYITRLALNGAYLQQTCEPLQFRAPAADEVCPSGKFLRGIYTAPGLEQQNQTIVCE